MQLFGGHSGPPLSKGVPVFGWQSSLPARCPMCPVVPVGTPGLDALLLSCSVRWDSAGLHTKLKNKIATA